MECKIIHIKTGAVKGYTTWCVRGFKQDIQDKIYKLNNTTVANK